MLKSRRYLQKNIKVSIGIACVRWNNNKPEMILVCKKQTYAFTQFLHGKYSNNLESIKKLLNLMTVDEKIDILSMDFDRMWYRVWFDDHIPLYYLSKNKFENMFKSDNGNRLKKMIYSSINSDKIWEIPKGRRKPGESDIHCAIREFQEETNIYKKHYKLYLKPIVYTYIDFGIKYVNIYYLGLAKHNINPSINLGSIEQIREVSDVRWMNIEAIRHIDKSKRLVNFAKKIFKFAKSRL